APRRSTMPRHGRRTPIARSTGRRCRGALPRARGAHRRRAQREVPARRARPRLPRRECLGVRRGEVPAGALGRRSGGRGRVVEAAASRPSRPALPQVEAPRGGPGPYTPTMPILEALMTLAHLAAVTTRVTLGTEVLVLPQRHPTLVAKQVSTLDTLSGGRVRLGIGVGWQESEYEALGEEFRTRGARMDEAIRLLRACWSDAHVDFAGL